MANRGSLGIPVKKAMVGGVLPSPNKQVAATTLSSALSCNELVDKIGNQVDMLDGRLFGAGSSESDPEARSTTLDGLVRNMQRKLSDINAALEKILDQVGEQE